MTIHRNQKQKLIKGLFDYIDRKIEQRKLARQKLENGEEVDSSSSDESSVLEQMIK